MAYCACALVLVNPKNKTTIAAHKPFKQHLWIEDSE
jgi:hypothetical protein